MQFVDVVFSEQGLNIIDKNNNIKTFPFIKGSFIDICNNNINFWSNKIERDPSTSHIWLNLNANQKKSNIIINNFEFLKNISVSHEMIQGTNRPRYYTPDFDYSTLNSNFLTVSNTVIEYENKEYVTSIIYEFTKDGKIVFEWSLIEHLNDLNLSIETALVKRQPHGFFNMRKDNLVCNAVSKIPKNNLNDERFKEGNYLVSERRDGFIFIVDKDTKKIVWYTNGEELGYHSSHYPHMIPIGLEGEGNILFYNNGLMTTETSSIIEFNPLTKEIVFEYESESIKSAFRGSVQKTIEGTYIICASEKGILVEVDRNKNIIRKIQIANDEFLSMPRDAKWNPNNINRNVLNYYRAERIPYNWIDKIIKEYPNKEKELFLINLEGKDILNTNLKY